MSVFTPLVKTATATFVNIVRSTVIITNSLKAGSGYAYNRANLTYNQARDLESGDIVFYNSAGYSQTYTNVQKS